MHQVFQRCLATLEAHDVELAGFNWPQNDSHDAQRRTGISTAQNFRKPKESKLVLRRKIISIVSDKTNKRLFNVIREIQTSPDVVQRSGQQVAARRADDVSPQHCKDVRPPRCCGSRPWSRLQIKHRGCK